MADGNLACDAGQHIDALRDQHVHQHERPQLQRRGTHILCRCSHGSDDGEDNARVGETGEHFAAHRQTFTISRRPKRPCGRTARIAIRTAKAIASPNAVEMKPPASSSATPRTIPPIKAPEMLPMPPNTAATKPKMTRLKPNCGSTVPVICEMRMPASPASAPLTAKEATTTPRTGTPATAAASEIVRYRSYGAAPTCGMYEHLHDADQANGQHQDCQVLSRYPDTGHFHEIERTENQRGERDGLGAEEPRDNSLQEQAETERRHNPTHTFAGPGQRTDCNPFHQNHQDRREKEGHGHCKIGWQPG